MYTFLNMLKQVLENTAIDSLIRYRMHYSRDKMIEKCQATYLDNTKRFNKFDMDATTGARLCSVSDRSTALEMLPCRIVGHFGENCIVILSKLTPRLLSAKQFDFDDSAFVHRDHSLSSKWKQFTEEVAILQSLSYALIVDYKAAFVCRTEAFIFMEFCEFGPLKRHIGLLSFGVIKFWCFQMLLAVRYIHREGVVHRNLTPDNFLIRSDFSVALYNFAMAEKLNDRQWSVKGLKGSEGFIAPELLSSNGETPVDAYKADYYSLGMSLLCVATKQTDPCKAMSVFKSSHEVSHISDAKLRFALSRLVDENPRTRHCVAPLIKNLLWGLQSQPASEEANRDIVRGFLYRSVSSIANG